MASVEIFVDDAVRGNPPFVCAKTGQPADGLQRIEQKIGGPSALLALLVFVPIVGWCLLLEFIAFSAGRATLTVRVPISRQSLATQHYWRRWWIGGWAAVAVFVVAAIARALHEPPWMWLVFAAAAFVVAIAAYAAMCVSMVRVRLDASRRWVTLSGVDPAFRDAVLDQRRGISEPHSV
ncbi:MAG TPA: hypothetical protein VGO03_14625 [Acidimicrobiia bacterium]|jgi:hypothetical protein